MLRFDCYSYFIVQVGLLRLCVIESVNFGCCVLMGYNCFVCDVVGSSQAAWSRRMRLGQLEVALPELCLVGSKSAKFRLEILHY